MYHQKIVVEKMLTSGKVQELNDFDDKATFKNWLTSLQNHIPENASKRVLVSQGEHMVFIELEKNKCLKNVLRNFS